jgi:thiol:disulfide interchange protein
MTRSRALITSIFFASLAGAVGLAAYNGQQDKSATATLVPAENDNSQKSVEQPKIAEPNKKVATSVKWESSFEDAMKRAKSEGKPILIDFYTDWCTWCKEMDKTVYPNQQVIDQSQNWVMVKINGEKRADVAKAYGVQGFPTVVFAENTGKPIEILPGFAKANEFVTIMQGAFSKWSPPTSA